MTDALLLVLGLGADAHAFLARVRARHHHAPGRENRTQEAAMAIPVGGPGPRSMDRRGASRLRGRLPNNRDLPSRAHS
jgi:hypothetical protein